MFSLLKAIYKGLYLKNSRIFIKYIDIYYPMPYYCHLREDMQKLVFDTTKSDVMLLKGPENCIEELLYLDTLPNIKKAAIEIFKTPKGRDRVKDGLNQIGIIRIDDYRPVSSNDFEVNYTKTIDPQSEVKEIEVLHLTHPNLLSGEQPEDIKKKLASFEEGTYFAAAYKIDDSLRIGFYRTSNFKTTVDGMHSYAKLRCAISI
jgi:hypothetical protein